MIDGTAIPKFLYGIIQWTFCLIVLFYVPKRFKKVKYSIIASIILTAVILIQLYFETTPSSVWILTIIGIYLVMFGFVLLMGKISGTQALYLSAQAFVYAQFAAAIVWQFYYFFGNNLSILKLDLLLYLLFVVVLIGVSLVIYLIYRHYHQKGYQLDIRRNDMITVLSIAVIVFFVSNLSFLGVDTPLSSTYPEEIFYIRTLVDLCGVVVIIVLQEYQIISYSQRELAAVQNAFHRHYNQYVQSKENIDLANQRYHDIRHQIHLIRAETDANKKDEYLKDFESAIKEYHIQADTGNGIIDTIVTSKKIRCDEANISFTYMVDGESFNFMSTIDITSLFGNMLDNAIESVSQVKNKEKRIINLNVYVQHSLLIIDLENYYEHDLKYERGKLVSTKNESFNHGYGIKSIKSVSDRYDGVLRIKTKDHWFMITILFPLNTK